MQLRRAGEVLGALLRGSDYGPLHRTSTPFLLETYVVVFVVSMKYSF